MTFRVSIETMGGTTHLLDLHDLTNMKGKQLRLDARLSLHEAESNPSRRRMLDWESNKRKRGQQEVISA